MRPVALALLGPTASGKSALALRLAEQLALEIVSVDAAWTSAPPSPRAPSGGACRIT
jgi:shikimate kinase